MQWESGGEHGWAIAEQRGGIMHPALSPRILLFEALLRRDMHWHSLAASSVSVILCGGPPHSLNFQSSSFFSQKKWRVVHHIWPPLHAADTLQVPLTSALTPHPRVVCSSPTHCRAASKPDIAGVVKDHGKKYTLHTEQQYGVMSLNPTTARSTVAKVVPSSSTQKVRHTPHPALSLLSSFLFLLVLSPLSSS
jgi:hypothetical protein